MSSLAVNWSENNLGANTEVVLVESTWTSTASNLGSIDCVEWASGASSLEGEGSVGTGQNAYSAAVQRITTGADAHTIGNDLVVAAGVAVALIIKDLISLALTCAG